MPRRFRPSMRSNRTLLILTVVSVLAYVWAEHSRVSVPAPYYEQKLAASQWMKTAQDSLRQYQYARGIFPDEVNDPNLTALIGQQYTKITTDIGDLESKWTALNPNMAAVMINYLHESGMKEGDQVAVGMSGSLPGMNLALLAACETMGINPIIITSVGASSWGANDPNFTWLDMEHYLMEIGLVSRRSIAASYGGGEDMGGRLSPEGRDLIKLAMERNGVTPIEEETLEKSIETRLRIFDEYAGENSVKLYINIGGGLASVGHGRNSELIPVGYSDYLPLLNYPRRGLIHEYSDRGIPVLHIANINYIANEFDLPKNPSPLPNPGEGLLFSEERYNLWISIIALLIVGATMGVVLLFDRRAQRMDRPGVDPDTLI